MHLLSVMEDDYSSIYNQEVYGFVRFNFTQVTNEQMNVVTFIRCNLEHLKLWYMGQLNFAMNNYDVKATIAKLPSKNIVVKLLFDRFLSFDKKNVFLDARSKHEIKQVDDNDRALDYAIKQSYVSKYIPINVYTYIYISFT